MIRFSYKIGPSFPGALFFLFFALLTSSSLIFAETVVIDSEEDALKECLVRSSEIKIAQIDVEISKQEIIAGLYPFDPELTVSYSKRWDEKIPNVNYDSVNYTEITEGPSIGIQKLFDLGTKVEFSLQQLHITSESTQAISRHRSQSAAQIKLTQPILKEFGANSQDVKRRKAIAQSRGYIAKFQDTKNKECYDFIEALLSYNLSQEELIIEKADLQFSEKVLAADSLKEKLGKKSKVDLLETLSKVEKKKAKVAEVELEMAKNINKLKGQLSLDSSDELIIKFNLLKESTPHPLEVDKNVKILSAQKVMDLRQQKIEEEQQLKKDKQDLLPKLDLEVEYLSTGLKNKSSKAFEESIKLKYPSWSVALNFNWPFGNSSAEGAYQASISKVASKRQEMLKQVAKVKSEEESLISQYKEEELRYKALQKRLGYLDQISVAKEKLQAAQLIPALDLFEARQKKLDHEMTTYKSRKELFILNAKNKLNYNLLIP